MAYSISDLNELEGFEEVEYSKGCADVTLVAGNKLVLHGGVIEHLKISKDDLGRKTGKSRAKMKLNPNKKELLIYKESGSFGTVLGGKLSAVELYSAPVCKKILEIIGKRLAGSGTIGFTSVETKKTTEDIPYIIVKLDSYTAKSGVFVEEK